MLGLGHMAQGIAWNLQRMDEAELWACASRDGENARRFAAKYGFVKAYGGYEAIYEDGDVELVYIASTNDRHYEQARECLLHGKHVLCEKPLTVYAWQAEELVRLAGERGLFLMEAQLLRFLPMAGTLRQIIASGAIGQPVFLSASFISPLEKVERVIRPELGGGALLDIGVYPLTLADMVLGPGYVCAASHAVLASSGVDAVDHILLRGQDGMLASLTASIRGSSYRDGRINGTEGYLIIREANRLSRFEQYGADGAWVKSWDSPPQLSVYFHELSAAIKAVQQGKTQCQEYPWPAMLAQMRFLDQLRRQWGVADAVPGKSIHV